MQETLRSPISFMASFLGNRNEIPELVLVTGESGCGKTTWCLELARQAQQSGLSPIGLVSPGVFEAGRKLAIDLLEVHTGERRRLALRRPENATRVGSAPRTRAWQFDTVALDWGNRSLDGLPAGDVLILDELGPLELLENKGLVSGLKLVDARILQPALVVIRPVLLATAQERWPWGVVLDLSKTHLGTHINAPGGAL